MRSSWSSVLLLRFRPMPHPVKISAFIASRLSHRSDVSCLPSVQAKLEWKLSPVAASYICITVFPPRFSGTQRANLHQTRLGLSSGVLLCNNRPWRQGGGVSGVSERVDNTVLVSVVERMCSVQVSCPTECRATAWSSAVHSGEASATVPCSSFSLVFSGHAAED